MYVSNISIVTIRLHEANKSYIWRVPVGTKRFAMQSRGGAEIRISTIPGNAQSQTEPYLTLKNNTSYSESDLNILDNSQCFYLASAIAGEVVEIIVGV